MTLPAGTSYLMDTSSIYVLATSTALVEIFSRLISHPVQWLHFLHPQKSRRKTSLAQGFPSHLVVSNYLRHCSLIYCCNPAICLLASSIRSLRVKIKPALINWNTSATIRVVVHIIRIAATALHVFPSKILWRFLTYSCVSVFNLQASTRSSIPSSQVAMPNNSFVAALAKA